MLATRAALLLLIVMGLGLGFKTPAASGSFHIGSISKLIKVWLPHFLEYVVTPETILKDEISVSNWLGTLKIKNIHLHDNIDFTNVLISGYWSNDKKLTLALVGITMQVDFDYEVDTITTFKGYGDAKAVKIGLLTGISLYLLPNNQWTVSLTQDKMTVNEIDLYLSQSVLDALAQLGKDKLQDELLSALKDEVYPYWNQIIYNYATSSDPNNGAITLDTSGYFLSGAIKGIPYFSQQYDYVEVQFNGLSYETSTLDTYATNDLTWATINLALQEQQVNLSDNTIESLIPALLKLYAHQVQIKDTDQTYKPILEFILPSLDQHFDQNVIYELIIDYKNNQPEVTIQKDLMTLKHIILDLDLYGTNGTVNEHAVHFTMELTVAVSGNVTDFKAYGQVKVAEIEPNTFQVTSYIGDLGKTDAEIEQLFSDLLSVLMDTLSSYIEEYDLSTLVPTKFNYILTNIKDVGVLLGDQLNFMRVGFSYQE